MRTNLVSCLRSSFKKFDRCQRLEANSNPPLSPFFKGGILSVVFIPLFQKEGKGRFFARASWNYVANFWVTTLVGLLRFLVIFLLAGKAFAATADKPKDNRVVKDGMLVSLDYTLKTADGKLIETNQGKEPLKYI